MKKQLFLSIGLIFFVTGLQAKTVTVKKPEDLKNINLKVGDTLALRTFIKGHFRGTSSWYDPAPSKDYFNKSKKLSYTPIPYSSYSYVTTRYTALKPGTVTIIGKTGSWREQYRSKPKAYSATITITK